MADISKKHFHAGTIFLFTLAAFALLIATNKEALYEYQISVLTVSYFFTGVNVAIGNTHEYGYWTDSDSSSNQRQLYETLQSLNIVATVATGIVWIGLALRCFCKIFPKLIRKFLKWAIFIATVLSPIVTLVAWAVLFAQPYAFKKDSGGVSTLTCTFEFCEKFSGSAQSNHVKWGPQTGWWLTLAAFILCFFSAALIIQGRKRYKYSKI